MNLYKLIQFIEFIAQFKSKVIQIKNKYETKINVISNKLGFQMHDKINNIKQYNMLDCDAKGNIYYSNKAKYIYTYAKYFSFVAYEILQKSYIVIHGNSINRNCILNESETSLIEKILTCNSDDIILINKNYFSTRFNFLINNIQFIKENMDLLTKLYKDYKYDLIKQYPTIKIILNCLIDIKQDYLINKVDNLNDDYQILFDYLILFTVYPLVDIDTRHLLKDDIKNLHYELINLLDIYNLQDYIQIADFKPSLNDSLKITSMYIITCTIYFEDFIDILLLSELIESINIL